MFQESSVFTRPYTMGVSFGDAIGIVSPDDNYPTTVNHISSPTFKLLYILPTLHTHIQTSHKKGGWLYSYVTGR